MEGFIIGGPCYLFHVSKKTISGPLLLLFPRGLFYKLEECIKEYFACLNAKG